MQGIDKIKELKSISTTPSWILNDFPRLRFVEVQLCRLLLLEKNDTLFETWETIKKILILVHQNL